MFFRLTHSLPSVLAFRIRQNAETACLTFSVTRQCSPGLEADLDRFNEDLPPLKDFILPGGSESAARCHLARTVCRRAERLMVSLAKVEDINEASLRYLNRLSDLLFVIARVLARANGGSEVLWVHGDKRGKDE